MGFTNPLIIYKVASAISLLAVMAHVVGFVSEDWLVAEGTSKTLRRGLWKWCLEEFCFSIFEQPVSDLAYFRAAQAMETIGLISAVAAVIGTVFVVFGDSFKERVLLTAAFSLAACTTIIIGVTIIAIDIILSLASAGYSLYLSAAGGVLSFITAVLLFRGKHQSLTVTNS